MKPNAIRRSRLAWMLAGLAVSVRAMAALPDEIQVYADDINAPGTAGLELHLNATPRGTNRPDYPGEVTTHHGLRVTPEFSYGISRVFEAGLYLPVVFSGGNSWLAGYKLRLKWLPLQPDAKTGGAFFGANVEYSDVQRRFEASRHNSELRLIGGYRNEQWLFAVNPIFGWALSTSTPQAGPQFDLAYKVSRRVADGIALGAEYYNDKGRWLHFDAAGEQGKTLYAVLDFDREPWVFNFAVGRGLNDATDRWTIKAIFELPFK